MTKRLSGVPSALLIGLLLATVAVVVLATAHTYSPSSGLFPKFIGWIFLGLALIEVSVQMKSFFALRRRPAPDAVSDHAAGIGRDVLRELKGFLWLGSLLAVLYLAGFLVAIPLFIFAFLRISGGKSMLECSLVSVLATAIIYLLFVRLLDYRLYSGILLGA